MKELTLDATVENTNAVTDFVNEQLEERFCSMKIMSQIDVAIDDIFSNIALYAYPSGVGKATVRVEFCENPTSVVLTFIDNGIPYNPLEKEDPDVTLSAEERQIGGLGIFMVKKLMNEMIYEYKDNQNILKLRKNL